MTLTEAMKQADSRAALLSLPCYVFGPDSNGDYWTALPRAARLWHDREPVFTARPLDER